MSSPPRGAVPTRIIRRKIEGRSCAICCATMPPSEKPRTSQDVSTKPVQERKRMLRHAGDRVRHLACGPPETCAFEQNDLSSRCQRVGDRGIPVIERSGEVLKKHQGKSGA